MEYEKKQGGITLNHFLARAGKASRRGAVDEIKKGFVLVNGTVVRDPGYRVFPADHVVFMGEQVKRESLRYILLNKPRDYVTTRSDERGRKKVIDLLGNDFHARVFPVGRLDRNTEGVLLLTNDGDLAQKLAHPRYEISKLYYVVTRDDVSPEELETIRRGVIIVQHKRITVDRIEYAHARKKNEIMVTLHSGYNRVIRHIFEKLGHDIRRLVRTGYAHLTCQDLFSGQWRDLTYQEVKELRAFVAPKITNNDNK